jgi:hypothetical protein
MRKGVHLERLLQPPDAQLGEPGLGRETDRSVRDTHRRAQPTRAVGHPVSMGEEVLGHHCEPPELVMECRADVKRTRPVRPRPPSHRQVS